MTRETIRRQCSAARVTSDPRSVSQSQLWDHVEGELHRSPTDLKRERGEFEGQAEKCRFLERRSQCLPAYAN